MSGMERRQHPRYSPAGLKVAITLSKPSDIVNLYGEVVDISLCGIKIKLDVPSTDDLEGDIKISLFLPDIEIPIFVKGVLKYVNEDGNLGVHYLDYPIADTLNKFMFDCMKLASSTENLSRI
ncbi:hypothetical protein MCAMS1_00793 [biofilm metagenome]